MTYALNEAFDDPRGRWNQFAPWDGTEASDSVKGFLATQEHVNLRNFKTITSLVAVPQNPDLDTSQQSALDAEQQSAMEQKVGSSIGENWLLTVTTGTNNDLLIGKDATRGGWSRAKFTTNSGAALGATLESVITTGIDISNEDNLSIIFPDYNTFDTATSYIQLCSGGAFGAGHDSVQVLFSANGSVMPQLRLAISAFANAGFDPTNITGVRIHLVKSVAPPNNSVVTVMAIRALKTAWQESALDFDTRLGAVCVPVTLTGSPYAGTIAKNFEFVRGDGSKNDPIPADLAMNMYFYPGGATSPNDATGSNFNKIGFILRETKIVSAGTGSHIEAFLNFNDTSTTFEVRRVDTTGGSPGTPTVTGDATYTVGGPLDPTKYYLFRVEIKGTQIDAKVYETDVNGNVVSTTWFLPVTVTNSAYTMRNGRVGFLAGLLTRDAYISNIQVAPTGYAMLQTQVYTSRSPIDGAQLAAVSASDENLFQAFVGSDLFVDHTKTVSGAGSYRTALGLTTNTFIVDDWTQTYFDMALWVPSTVTANNQPILFLNTATTQQTIVVPKLQPAQWNFLHFDLGLFRNLITGTGYSLTVKAATSPDKPLGNFWIDEPVIGRRRVAWSVRATPNGLFRPFKDLVNDPNGAVHFNANERGTSLQLKAVALTQDAWVSSFKLFPRYAQLGLPIYDQAFATR